MTNPTLGDKVGSRLESPGKCISKTNFHQKDLDVLFLEWILWRYSILPKEVLGFLHGGKMDL